MIKFIFLILSFSFYATASYSYIDPVTTSILYQILFFLIAGFLIFFLKIKKLIILINKDYKYSNIVLYFLCFFPAWVFLSDLSLNEIYLVFFIFFFIPLIIIYTLYLLILKNNNKNLFIFLNSLIITYGLDQALGFASIINMLRIIDAIIRYSYYGLFLLLFFFLSYILISKNYKISNYAIIVMFITISFNLINNEKNIKDIKKYEIIEKDVSDIQIEKQNNNKNPTIILILDEMNGAGGLNKDIKNTKVAIESLDNLFKEFNFTHYPNAYSIYASTVNSVPSILNFNYDYDYEKVKNNRKKHNVFGFYEKITKNKLFDLFNPSKIYIYQTLGLDFCFYENFKLCKMLNPFSKNNRYIKNFKLNKYDYIFSQYTFQTSIFATLLTRTLRYHDLVKIIEPRMIGKAAIESSLNEISLQANSKKYNLLVGHLFAPHKPFAWDEDSCNYKYYQNPNFLSDVQLQEFHNIEIKCMNKYLRNFLNKLSKNNLLDYYNIIIFSDHGAKNLNLTDNKLDWHSTLYAEKIVGENYKKNYDIKSVQFLFSKFFNKVDEDNLENKYYDIETSEYKSNINKLFFH